MLVKGLEVEDRGLRFGYGFSSFVMIFGRFKEIFCEYLYKKAVEKR